MTLRTRTAPALFALTAALALSGCVKLGTKPPARLMTLAMDAAPDTGAGQSSQGLPSLAVAAPDIPRKLATTRIPVQVDPTAVAYVRDAQWTEAPRDLFRRLLETTLAAESGTFVVDDAQYGLRPQRLLSGELVDFGLDAQTREAVVTYDAVLTRIDTHQAERRRFTARVPAPHIKASTVAAPLSRAANQVAHEVAAWVKQGN